MGKGLKPFWLGRSLATFVFSRGYVETKGVKLAPRLQPSSERAFGEPVGHRFLRLNRPGKFRKRELPLNVRLSKSARPGKLLRKKSRRMCHVTYWFFQLQQSAQIGRA